MSYQSTKRILVLGGGFGGLAFVNRFHDSRAIIDLVDRENHHLFQPLLYQVATAGLSAPEIAQPLRSIFSKRSDVDVLMEDVERVDLNRRRVITNRGVHFYDYLVVGMGSRSNFFGNDGWSQHCIGLKSLGDAHRIRNRVLRAFERAESCSEDDSTLDAMLTFVVIGGGPTGLEMAGSLAELCKRMLRRDFKRIDSARARVVLVEASPRLLGNYPEALSESARKQLEELDVEVRLGTPVSDIREGEVLVGEQRIQSDTILWTAGVAANEVVESMIVPKDSAGRIKVESDCSIPGYPEAFVVGDMVHLVDAKGQAVPGVAPSAIQMGKHVADLLMGEMKDEPGQRREAFVYKDKGSMATIGRSRAVADIGGRHFRGPLAWVLWLFIHLVLLVGLRNKLAVMLQWFYHYVRFRPGARIIWRADGEVADAEGDEGEKPLRRAEGE